MHSVGPGTLSQEEGRDAARRCGVWIKAWLELDLARDVKDRKGILVRKRLEKMHSLLSLNGGECTPSCLHIGRRTSDVEEVEALSNECSASVGTLPTSLKSLNLSVGTGEIKAFP